MPCAIVYAPISISRVGLQHLGYCPTSTAHTRCKYDQCIMDDIYAHASPQHMIMINNVQLYLHINMLSEITHSNGRQLLDHMLESSATPAPSTLPWPHQPCPPPTAWNVWKNVLHQIYTKGYDNNLQQPLKAWHYMASHEQWRWEWLICPTSLRLYHHNSS